jgi:peptidoglycan/xylan/chitin deacetylase (PgdA/CDA1 family)
VLANPDPLLPDDVDAATFRTQMEVLARGWRVLPLHEAVRALREGTLPRRALAITFDDGYADNHDVAMPILRGLGLHGTFFIATGFLDGGRMWNDTIIESVRRASDRSVLGESGGGSGGLSVSERREWIGRLISSSKHLAPGERAARAAQLAERVGKPLPDDLMMTSAQVRSMAAAGMEIGAHTVSHPVLSTVDAPTAVEEIRGSAATLTALTGIQPRGFAYPNGQPQRDYRTEHVRMVRDLGFDFAVSTSWGRAERDSDPHQLPRVAPWERTLAGFERRLLVSYLQRQATRA